MVSPARRVAFKVLQATEDGGYASDLLLKEAATLDSRDAGLASEIVFGCLRRQGQLDWLIASVARRDADRMDIAVRIALRMGLYQLRHLDRVPAHASLNESVELVKMAKKTSAAGLVNAVLRRAPRGRIEWPDRSVALSMPQWLLARWDEQFGAGSSEKIAEAFLSAPETYVRNPAEDSGVVLEPTDVPGAFRVVSGDPTGLRIQDIGSQSVVPFLDLRPGQTLLDLCSAPGNKTAQALESGIRGIACDVNHRRLQTVSGCSRVVLDATVGLPFHSRFDRVLVDAPCSGTGTLGRNPEIRWKLRPRDVEELHEKQVRILRNALEALADDGRLVYSTCSLEKLENEEVIERITAETGHRILETRYRVPGRDPGDGFFAAVVSR
ncbi:MAG TPA: transcription antitermination factor NusB [Bryobacteraceae bacterium]|nr:transcription antitermination factor NusB [Bryobacteraceae bacterium]